MSVAMVAATKHEQSHSLDAHAQEAWGLPGSKSDKLPNCRSRTSGLHLSCMFDGNIRIPMLPCRVRFRFLL